MTKHPFSAALNFFLNHPAITGTVIYFYISSTGAIYTWALYKHFNINAFDVAEANDFLLIPFKEPHTIVQGIIVICSILAFHFFFRGIWEKYLSNTTKRIAQWYYRWGIPIILIVLLTFVSIVPSLVIAKNKAYNIIDNIAPTIKVHFKDVTEDGNTFKFLSNVALVGTTEKFIIIYFPDREQSLAVPIQNILYIDFNSQS